MVNTSIENLKKIAEDKYLKNGIVIELVQPGEDNLRVQDFDVDNLSVIIKSRIKKIIDRVDKGNIDSELEMWIERVMKTDMTCFMLFSKRILNLEYLNDPILEETLNALYNRLIGGYVNSYIDEILLNKDSEYIKVNGMELS